VDQEFAQAGSVAFDGEFSHAVDWAAAAIEVRASTYFTEITIMPESHDFGAVGVGQSATASFDIRNDGDADLHLPAISLHGASAAEFSITSGGAPNTLVPNATHTVVVTLAPESLGPKSAWLRIVSNDADELTTDVALSGNAVSPTGPDIAVTPTSHDFGDVTGLTSVTLDVLVRNEGSDPLGVTSTSVVGPDSLEFTVTNGGAPFTVGVGDSAGVSVTFAPATTGAKSAILRISSDDPDEANVDVALSGNALPPPEPEIAVEPTMLDFGNVATLSSMTFDVLVRNVGSDSLDVLGTAVTGPDSLQFAITGGGAPFTLAFDDSAVIRVTFTPSSDGPKSATLQVQSNDPEQGALPIALTGVGIAAVPGMIVFEESVSGDASGSPRVETETSLAAVDGHLYLAAVATRGYQPVAGVTGMGLTWTLVKAQCAGRQQTAVEVWLGSGTPSTGVVTATMQTEPSKAVIIVSRYSGANPSDAIGAVVSANTNGEDGDCTGGEDDDSFDVGMQTSTSNALVYTAVAMRHRFLTAGNGYTLRDEERRGSEGMVASLAVLDQEFEVPTTITIDGSFSGDVDWAVVGIEIKPAPVTTKQTTQDAVPVHRPELTLRNGIGGIDPWIELSAPRAELANVRIYDVRGRLVDVPWNGPTPAGRVKLDWSGVDRSGKRLPAGVYLVRAEIGTRVLAGKLIILR
jgi:hypothetical protein